jgi:hypothetical protein
MKIGDAVETSEGFAGTIIKVYYRSSAGSTCSYVSSFDIMLDNGIVVNVCKDLVKLMSK